MGAFRGKKRPRVPFQPFFKLFALLLFFGWALTLIISSATASQWSNSSSPASLNASQREINPSYSESLSTPPPILTQKGYCELKHRALSGTARTTTIKNLVNSFCSLQLAAALLLVLLPPAALTLTLYFISDGLHTNICTPPRPRVRTLVRTIVTAPHAAAPTAALPNEITHNTHLPAATAASCKQRAASARTAAKIRVFLNTLPVQLDLNAPIGEQIRTALASPAGLNLCHSLHLSNTGPDDCYSGITWMHNHHTIKLTASAHQLGIHPDSTLTARISNGLGGTSKNSTFPPADDTAIVPQPTARVAGPLQCTICSASFPSTQNHTSNTLLAAHWNKTHSGTPVPDSLTNFLVTCGWRDIEGKTCPAVFSQRGIEKHRTSHKSGDKLKSVAAKRRRSPTPEVGASIILRDPVNTFGSGSPAGLHASAAATTNPHTKRFRSSPDVCDSEPSLEMLSSTSTVPGSGPAAALTCLQAVAASASYPNLSGTPTSPGTHKHLRVFLNMTRCCH